MKLVKLDEIRKDSIHQNLKGKIYDYGSWWEYHIVDEYHNKFTDFEAHGIQISDVFCTLLQMKEKTFFVSIQFEKSKFTQDQMLLWLANYNIHFEQVNKDAKLCKINNGHKIVTGLRFFGNPIVLYTVGKDTLKFNPLEFHDIVDYYKSYEQQVNTFNCKALSEDKRDLDCSQEIFLNGKKLGNSDRIRFSRGDLVIVNGLIIKADYLGHYHGSLAFYSRGQGRPLTFLIDSETKVYITTYEIEDRTFYFINYNYAVNPDELVNFYF